MSDNHGNTPAAWTAVTVAMLGFVVGAVGLLLEPISWPIFWVGVALGVASLVIFAVMVKLGFHESQRTDRGGLDDRHRAAAGRTRGRRGEPVAAAGRSRGHDRRAGGSPRSRCTCATRTRAAPGATARARRSGIYCPGCGGLRAVNDLTNGDVAAAASSNLLFVALLPLLVFLLGRWAYERWTGRVRQPNNRRVRTFLIALGVAAVVFTVLRNLEIGAWLAP